MIVKADEAAKVDLDWTLKNQDQDYQKTY